MRGLPQLEAGWAIWNYRYIFLDITVRVCNIGIKSIPYIDLYYPGKSGPPWPDFYFLPEVHLIVYVLFNILIFHADRCTQVN